MRLLGVPKLEEFKKAHADTRGALDAWRKEVEQANWQTSQDIKRRYPSADFLAGNRVIFNIKGNSYRLVVKVRYQADVAQDGVAQEGTVLVEWIGTHAEYDKKKF